MQHVVSLRSAFPVSAEELWAWHGRPLAFERLNPPWDPVEVLERTGGLEVGARTRVRVRVPWGTTTWLSGHTVCEPGRMFRDEQRQGPFARWVHEHRITPKGPAQSELEDHVEYELPLGPVGVLGGAALARKRLEQAFHYRHALLRADLERHARFAHLPRLTVAVTGASGLLGQALTAYLATAGHTVKPVRRSGEAVDVTALDGVDAVVHLAGAGLADARWTDTRKQALRKSRVALTAALVNGLAASRRPPKVLVSGSAVGVYGDRADEELTEASAPGPRGEKGAAFLSTLCQDWEEAARGAERHGVRVVLARSGVVLTAQGGALARQLPPFRAGLGGPLAGGKAYLAWISQEDWLGAVEHALHDQELQGPVNVVAPAPVTNRDFTRALGAAVRRPAVTPVPRAALVALFGELADGALLASQRAVPSALLRRGFEFRLPTVEAALAWTLGVA